MRSAANGRGASTVPPAPHIVTKWRQLHRQVDWFNNQASTAPTQAMRDLWTKHKLTALRELDALEGSEAMKRMRDLAPYVKPGLFFVMTELDGAQA